MKSIDLYVLQSQEKEKEKNKINNQYNLHYYPQLFFSSANITQMFIP